MPWYRGVAQSGEPEVRSKGDLGRCGTPFHVGADVPTVIPHGGTKPGEQGSRDSSLQPSQLGPHLVSQEEGNVTQHWQDPVWPCGRSKGANVCGQD